MTLCSYTDPLNRNVWSKSSDLAMSVAKTAGGGNTPIGPEIHFKPGEVMYYHYHTYDRSGGHSYF